jgi:hypothetical protein
VNKFWSLTRQPQKVSEQCPDGWTVSHTFLNEIAQFHKEMIQEYEKLIYDLKQISFIEIPTFTFTQKVLLIK